MGLVYHDHKSIISQSLKTAQAFDIIK